MKAFVIEKSKLAGTNCAPVVADLFLFCHEMDFMMYFYDDKQADIIDAFKAAYSVTFNIFRFFFIFFLNHL